MTVSENPYRIREEPGQRILEIDYSKSVKSPSIENSETIMADTLNKIIKSGEVTQIEFKQQEDILYPTDQTKILDELASMIKDLVENAKILVEAYVKTIEDPSDYPGRLEFLKSTVNYGLKEDPLASYLRILARIDKEQKIGENISRESTQSRQVFITTLTSLKDRFEKLSLFKLAQPHLSKHKPGSREVYRQIFSPIIKPNFIYAKL
ncbi:uncharacterized protein METZ01_LOCUS257517, partial [marine metagenome]